MSNGFLCSFLFLLGFVELSLVRFATCNDCILHTNSTEKRVLLNRISLLKGHKFYAEKSGLTYAVSMCSDVSPQHHNASVTRTKISSNTSTVLGRNNDVDIVGQEKWVMVVYSNGDVNTEDKSCNGSRWKSMVLISCGTESDDINLRILDDRLDGCIAMFHISSSVVCPPPEGLGQGSVFLILLVTGVICYLVVGVAYRRLITGAKGVEQIPNYQFWHSIVSCPMTYLRRNDETNPSRDDNWRSGSSGRRHDQVDEPLLSP